MSIQKLTSEYLRPWKLVTLFTGVIVLVIGSFYYKAPDWDVGISVIMAVCAYLTAPFAMRALLERKWRYFPLVLIVTWFSVDGCYSIYWYFNDPAALELMREANFLASLPLYGLCGILWMYRGNLSQLYSEFRMSLYSFRKSL